LPVCRTITSCTVPLICSLLTLVSLIFSYRFPATPTTIYRHDVRP
jgi:hypothetical protein